MTRNPHPYPSVGDLLAVDPATRSPGVALFRGGALVAADTIKIDPDIHELGIGARCPRVAAEILRWAFASGASPKFLVLEWPVIYPEGKAKKGKRGEKRHVRPADILKIAGVGAAVAGMLSLSMSHRNVGLQVASPEPAEWIGQVPKATTGDAWASPRGALVRACLSAAELERVAGGHDSIDAVGLGLWALGRLVSVIERARPGSPALARVPAGSRGVVSVK